MLSRQQYVATNHIGDSKSGDLSSFNWSFENEFEVIKIYGLQNLEYVVFHVTWIYSHLYTWNLLLGVLVLWIIQTFLDLPLSGMFFSVDIQYEIYYFSYR